MSPIWIIARREFTENILSLRLLIGLIVCLALFVASTYVLMEDYEKFELVGCLLYTYPSPRDRTRSRMPSSA